MTLSYELTFDDYREANGGDKPPKKKTARWQLVGWVLFVALVVVLFLLSDRTRRRQMTLLSEPAPPAAPYLHRFAAAVAPALLVGAGLGWAILKSTQKSAPKPWDPPPATGSAAKKGKSVNSLFGWVLFIGLAVILFALLNNQSSRRPPRALPPPPAGTLPFVVMNEPPEPSLEVFDFMLGFVPLVILLIVTVAIGRRGTKRQLQTTWDAQPFLQRPETVEATDDTITFVEPLSRRSYDWSYFAGFRETTNLLLLYLSPYSFHIIPKRAFVTQGDFDLFRGYLLSKVIHGHFLPQTSAFPVVPLAARAG